MTDRHIRPQRTARTAQDVWGQTGDSPGGSGMHSGARLALASMAMLLLAVLCVTAFLFVRAFSPDLLSSLLPFGGGGTTPPAPLPSESPAPGQAQVSLEPPQGQMGTLVTVRGQGWLPGEPVFVFLRSPDEGTGRGYTVAAAVADDSGRFRTGFTFPSEPRWQTQAWAEVIARGTRSGLEAQARFGLLAATPTGTLAATVRLTPSPTGTPTPTDTPTPTPTPVVIITDWQGEYYANATLSGSPALIRNDVEIRFDWGQGGPAPGLPADQFSVRWTRVQTFGAGLYRFSVGADDGVRFWIDGQPIVDAWRDGPYTVHTVAVDLTGGTHSLWMEYYENQGEARAMLSWQLVLPTETPTPTATITPTPTETPSPTPTPELPRGWLGEYFANLDLMGEPALVRWDPELDFDWGEGSPGEGLPADHFSARWTRDIWLTGGTYRISVAVDDGVRVWMDGLLLIDEWFSSGGAAYSVDLSIVEGTHHFQVEYFEDALTARIRWTIGAVPAEASIPGLVWRVTSPML